MNRLLAEVRVFHEIMLEMHKINGNFAGTDVGVMVDSNDIVNPTARDIPNSPSAAGMSVLKCWKAKQVFVSKRSQGTGCLNIGNPLFSKDNTRVFSSDMELA